MPESLGHLPILYSNKALSLTVFWRHRTFVWDVKIGVDLVNVNAGLVPGRSHAKDANHRAAAEPRVVEGSRAHQRPVYVRYPDFEGLHCGWGE
jgi:hypothetical protein